MNKYPILFGTFLFLFGTLTFSACKKSQRDPVFKKDLIIGTWSITQTAKDENKNGKPDPEELNPSPADQFNKEIFHADGTGTLTIQTPDIDTTVGFTWQLVNSDKNLQFTLLGNTNTVDINSISSTSMILEDKSNPDGSNWSYLSKQ